MMLPLIPHGWHLSKEQNGSSFLRKAYNHFGYMQLEFHPLNIFDRVKALHCWLPAYNLRKYIRASEIPLMEILGADDVTLFAFMGDNIVMNCLIRCADNHREQESVPH